jgi:TATA element modulatory factor
MAAPPKKASGWGSFLQQAVAGVESRLDTILAEGENEASKPAPKPATPTPAASEKKENGIRFTL